MRYDPNESYESWADRVQKYEHEIAIKRITKGDPIDVVLESMSKRIMEKLLFPILTTIKSKKSDFDIEASRRSYEENYLKHNLPRADHVDDDN